MPEAQRHVAHANRRFQRRPSWNRSVVSVPLCSICPDPALSYLASVVFEPLCSICPDTALLFLDSCAQVMLYPCGLALVFERLASVAMEPLRSMSPDSALPFRDSVVLEALCSMCADTALLLWVSIVLETPLSYPVWLLPASNRSEVCAQILLYTAVHAASWRFGLPKSDRSPHV